MTNAQRVKQFMNMGGQQVDLPANEPMPFDVLCLRHRLETEEHMEMIEALHNYAESEGTSAKDRAHLAKELADKLVISYGTLIAMGLDPDKVFNIVQDENDAKIATGTKRDDGKIIVSPEVKAQLKQETYKKLLMLVS